MSSRSGECDCYKADFLKSAKMNRRETLTVHVGRIPRVKRKQVPCQVTLRVNQQEIADACGIVDIAPVAGAFAGEEDCVVVENGGKWAMEVDKSEAEINWLHFRNYRHSPFARTPKNLKTALKRWRAYAAAPQRYTEPGAEQISFCYICGEKVDNAAEHRKSESHRARVAELDFKEFDEVKAEAERGQNCGKNDQEQ